MRFIIITSLFTTVFSYYHTTHNYLGSILEDYLNKHETGKIILKNINLKESFGDASVWPDKIKNRKEYLWSKSLHYIDINECSKDINEDINECSKDINEKFPLIKKYCNNNCIYSGIMNMTNDLKYNRNYINKDESFKFLLHFLQDLNQPMHLIGFYRGGNSYKIRLLMKDRSIYTNMHEIWDSIIPEYYLKNYKYEIKNINITNINNMDDYSNFISNFIYNNLDLGCKKIHFDNTEINFDDYFDKNIVESLFDNYMTLIVNTLMYIYI